MLPLPILKAGRDSFGVVDERGLANDLLFKLFGLFRELNHIFELIFYFSEVGTGEGGDRIALPLVLPLSNAHTLLLAQGLLLLLSLMLPIRY